MGAVFAVFAGFYYWIPKITGLMYNEVMAKIHFFTTFLGVNITFSCMHFLGWAGHQRRVCDFPDAYSYWNAMASYGSYLSMFSSLFFLFIIFDLFYNGVGVSENPWKANDGSDFIVSFYERRFGVTLEWLLSSPVGYHSFVEVPIVKETF